MLVTYTHSMNGGETIAAHAVDERDITAYIAELNAWRDANGADTYIVAEAIEYADEAQS